jgi:uroporphyrinogen decarboxylase
VSRLKNDTFLRALLRQPTEYTPVWLMRQAGRYLPEYCETRKRAGSFLNLCKSPAMACEVTLQPLARYDLDAAILFSDILTVPDAMGLGLYFAEGEGPRFERPLKDEWEIRNLSAPDPHAELQYVMDAVSEIRRALDGSVPLIGFSGSPWTLACYMVEGGSSDDYRKVKSLAYSRPDLMHHILEVTAQAVIEVPQRPDRGRRAGGDGVRLLGRRAVRGRVPRVLAAYMEQVVAGLIRERDGQRVPSIVFTKGGGLWLESIAAIGCDAVGLDWTMDIGRARQLVGDKVALQGNLDPNVLFAPPEAVATETRRVLDAYGNHPGHVFNLGHGISQFTPPENVSVLVDTVHAHSRAMRAGAEAAGGGIGGVRQASGAASVKHEIVFSGLTYAHSARSSVRPNGHILSGRRFHKSLKIKEKIRAMLRHCDEKPCRRRFEGDSPSFPTNLSTGFVDKQKGHFRPMTCPAVSSIRLIESRKTLT